MPTNMSSRFAVPTGALVMVAVLLAALAGCGDRPAYPEAKVTTPLGKPSVCAHCEKRIESVSEQNLVTIDGVQYIVCDEKCADGVKEWLQQMEER